MIWIAIHHNLPLAVVSVTRPPEGSAETSQSSSLENTHGCPERTRRSWRAFIFTVVVSCTRYNRVEEKWRPPGFRIAATMSNIGRRFRWGAAKVYSGSNRGSFKVFFNLFLVLLLYLSIREE